MNGSRLGLVFHEPFANFHTMPRPLARQSASALRRWVQFAVFLIFIVGVIYAADRHLARGFFGWVQSFPLGDKSGHFVLMGTLAFLLNRALAGRAIPPGVQLGGIIVAVFVVVEEFSQLWLPWRTFDYGDLVADFIGIALADCLARRFTRGAEGA